jgi:hypothetical protein
MDERAQSKVRQALLQWENEHGALYIGTRTQLIDAGLAQPGDFPGDPGSGRVTDHTFERDGRRIRITFKSRRAGSPPTFALRIRETIRQQNARYRKEVAERDCAAALAAREKAESALGEMPHSADQYRDRAARVVSNAIKDLLRPIVMGSSSTDAFAQLVFPHTGGYSFASDALAEFDEAIEDVIAVLRAGTVRLDRQARRQQIQAVRATAARGDPSFARFLTRATGDNA